MKRHEAIAPLSREHHSSLILAQLLKTNAPRYTGLPHSITDKAAYALAMYHHDIKTHFQKEEAMLALVRPLHPAIAALADTIIAEHKLLAALFLSLEKTPGTAVTLNNLGMLLESHIRKEERELFPLVQQYCPEEMLLQIRAIVE